MKKIESDFVKDQYRSGVESYANFTKDVGLWTSEKHVFQKYLKLEDRILDLGCGTGRTTFSLDQLGYRNILGVDLTPEMIYRAQELNDYFKAEIEFQIGDALNLNFENSSFDSLIFSFNGLMSIPRQSNRDLALEEIARVLHPSGVFIFTTHDRGRGEEFFDFWKEQEAIWANDKQNPLLHEFGDLITQSKNESEEIFIHIPNQQEINDWLVKFGFTVIETFYRIDNFDESEKVKLKSGECRFWIARKE